MRRKFAVKLLMVLALVVGSLVMVQQFLGVLGSSAPAQTKTNQPPSLAEIAKYRQWTLVNPSPVIMNYQAAIACDRAFGSSANPHETKWVSVYVNPTAAPAMMTKDQPHFAEGSIIVKEKLSDKLSNKPELLTVMIKRESGYNPESRDWEYLLVDGAATKIVERGKLSSCNGCHQKYVDTDFVTMRYVDWKPKVE